MNDLHRDVAWKLSDHGLIDLGGDGLNPTPESLATAARIVDHIDSAINRGLDEVSMARAAIAFEQSAMALLPPTGTTDHDAPSDVVDIVIHYRAPIGVVL